MIEADRLKPSRRIWLLVPITIVWTNLHGGFLALIAVLGVASVGIAIEAWMGRANFRDALRYGALTCACLASSLVNPYGYHLHQHVIEYLRSDWIRNVIQEFQSPSFRNENMLQFEGLLFIGLMVAGLLFRRGRVVEGLWIILFANMSLSSVRHVPVYVTVTVPIIAAEMAEWWRTWTANATKSSLPGIINAMAADSIRQFRRTSAWPVMCGGCADADRETDPVADRFCAGSFPGHDGPPACGFVQKCPPDDHRPVGGLHDLPKSRSEGVRRRP